MQNAQPNTNLNFNGEKDMKYSERFEELELEENHSYKEYRVQKDEQEMINLQSYHFALLIPSNCQIKQVEER